MTRFGYSAKGKPFPLTDAMIELRDNLARGLGYVMRRCSLGGKFECWERPDLTVNHRGVPCSPYHCVRYHEHRGKHWYSWPEQVEIAAWAIDRGKPTEESKESGNVGA